MKILEIVVTYNPNIELLQQSIESTFKKVDYVLVVDNSVEQSVCENEFSKFGNVKICKLKENFGIAKATNIGIEYALKNGFDYVFTSDQDTIYPSDYIENFKKNLAVASYKYKNIAAFAPVYVNKNGGEKNNLIFWNGKKQLKVKQEERKDINIKVFSAIASGMIIDVKKINQIGLMKEELFIDWVDLDWCYRCFFKGYDIISCKQMKIIHCLGDYYRNFFGYKYALHNPLRNYYLIRNLVYLSENGENYPEIFKKSLKKKVKIYVVCIFLLSKKHFKDLRYMLRGLKDGKNSRLGKATF